jgi:hypothetical protein
MYLVLYSQYILGFEIIWMLLKFNKNPIKI